ncbi:two-component system sensor histidine kinase NtrB [Methylovorus mays]|uniref:two-component system sensor histidine kinase NtrB n=1 Tax=Methylovorus mays TaxID=184077 RepID=UPI001E2ABF26|nr:ATP-binding protein [Methylovorus mays]MCB5207217.1 PAS domain-containing protein [Methylovorus mays]
MSSSLEASHTIEKRAFWRPMGLFNLYRLAIALIFVGSFQFLDDLPFWENFNKALYFQIALGYLGISLVAIIFTGLKKPGFSTQLTTLVVMDIGFIIMLMYASGGIRNGLGLLLVVAIAAASMISRGRLALFYASLATIALLLEQTYQLLHWQESIVDYSHAVMLSLSCYATAWLAHSLAKRARESEKLASERGVDLASMAQINALIIEEMHDGVLVVDHAMQLRHHNQQAITLLGLDPEAPAPTNLQALPEVAALMQDWMNDHTEQESIFKLQSAHHDLRLRFMPLNHQRDQGAVIFIEDWSQIQTQAHQIKLAALGKLTANIAHEIRNPLSAISHANQLLQEDIADPGSQKLLSIIADNAERLDHIVTDVLELNRRDRTQQQAVALDSFIQAFHEQFCQVENIPASGFVLDIQPGAHIVMFDHRHLNQILWNICRNGWRHGQKQEGSLHLGIRRSSRSRAIRIAIRDDGPGIAPDVMPHLFEPFYTTEATGTGLGLYIARELCQANNTRLECSSTPQGSLFTMTIKNG